MTAKNISESEIKIKDNTSTTPSEDGTKESEMKVSYLQLFRYSSLLEKFMVIFGILGAIVQGCTLPYMIDTLGNILQVFISLVVNIKIKNLTGIENDNIIKDLVNAVLTQVSSNDPSLMNEFIANNPSIDVNAMMENFKESEYGESLEGSTQGFTFLTMDEIWDEMYKYLIIFALIGVVSFIASYVFYAFLKVSSTRQSTRIRALVFRSILKQDITWHEKTSPGELSSRIISDTILIEDGIGTKIGILIQYLTTFVACFILAFISSWLLTLEMSVIFPLLAVVGSVMGVILKKFTDKSQGAYATIGGIAQEAFSQIRTIVSFGTEQKEIDRYNEKLKPTRKYGIIKAQTFGACLGLMFCIIHSSFFIAFFSGSRMIDQQKITSEEVFKVFMSIMMGGAMLSSCGSVMDAFGEATGAAAKLFGIIERTPEIDTSSGEKPTQPTQGNIEFRDVRFNYPARPDVEVLKGISFTCQPGHTIALVGASGSGKSTIVQLLERFYDKKSGHIYLDGKDIENFNVHWLRTQIGLVSQEPTLFDATIYDNISISCPGATQEQVEAAAKLANAHDFITKLPKGYQTSTGERGLQLSGGQKQRICIARALMMNPKILLLDEATSALDNQSEKIVQAALDSASAGRTTLVIAHRLTTVKNADCIIVLEKGIIIESGTHNELMAKQNVYYNLVKNQEMKIAKEMETISDDDTDDDEQVATLNEEVDLAEKIVSARREGTMMSKILSNTSFGRRNTSVSEMNKLEEQPVKNGKNYDSMDWKRYIMVNKPYWFANFIGLIGACINGGIQPAYAFIFGSAMDVFNKHGQELLDDGLFWGLMFIVIGVVNFFAFYFQVGGFSLAGECLTYNLRKRMYASMIRQEVGFFDTSDIGDGKEAASDSSNSGNSVSTGTLTAKLATEAGLVQGLNNNIGTVFQQIITVVSGFTIAFCCGWKLTLILLISVPFLFIGAYLEMSASKDKNEETRRIYETSSKVACEAIVSIKTVYALNLEDRFDALYEEKLREPEKRLERRAYTSSIGSGFSNGVSYFAYILGIYFGTIFIENGEMEFDNMFKVLLAVIFTASAVGQASSIAPEYTKAVNAFAHVLEILDRQPKIDASKEDGIKKEEGEFKGEISFNNIRFRYPSRPTVTVLRMGQGKIEIPAGKMCAIVGGSGCGKSTIIGLLPRWYDPTHGTIVVDGENNKDYNVKWLREQIGIVNQEPCLFNISVKDNIRYGRADATDEEIIEAAKKANIHEFIVSLPEGYDTVVGGIGTSKMSGGQKQRIAIARAMIRNPKVLLLDEATSALDAESELIVQKALEEASQGRTTITIAHRLSTIKNADIIVVMKDGKIVEMGNHESLMEKRGEYFNMVLSGDGSIQKGNEIAKKYN